jgi:TusA-related sulfurtransferase
LSEFKIAKTLDVKGLLCPIPVLKAKRAIGEIDTGEVMEILSTDPAAKVDIPVWARRTGHEVLEVKEEPNLLTFLVRRGR